MTGDRPGRLNRAAAVIVASATAVTVAGAAGTMSGAAIAFAIPAVAYAAPAHCPYTQDQVIEATSDAITVDEPWGQRRLALRSAWRFSTGAGIRVGVIDSGVNGQHPQLAGKVARGIDVLNAGNLPADFDCNGHGTAVAGIIAARRQPGYGMAGVAPDATIVPVRQNAKPDEASADQRDRTGSITTLVKAIDYLVGQRVDVMNLSLATDVDAPEVEAAIRRAVAADIVVVAAVGNRGVDGNPTPYPAALPGVIGVASVDENGRPAQDSGYGPFVDVAAPGVAVVGPAPAGVGHNVVSGTSFAAPYVAGVAALLRAYRPGLSAIEVAERISSTADQPGRNRPDPYTGSGVVNPLRALTSVGTGTESPAAVARNADRLPPLGPAADRNQGRRTALLTAGGIGLLTVLTIGAAVVIPRGRRRRWRPGSG